jgi:hypothetical protein
MRVRRRIDRLLDLCVKSSAQVLSRFWCITHCGALFSRVEKVHPCVSRPLDLVVFERKRS